MKKILQDVLINLLTDASKMLALIIIAAVLTHLFPGSEGYINHMISTYRLV